MNTKKVTFRLSSTTTQALLGKYQTKNFSDALQACIKDGILHHAFFTKNKRHGNPTKTLQRVRTENLPLTERKSVRINEDALNFLQSYYGCVSTSESIRCCISDVLRGVGKPQMIQPSNNLFYMAGQKNPTMQKILTACFASIKSTHKIAGYVEPFTGTGNVLLHRPEKLEHEFLNDNSADLVNLLLILRDYPQELKIELWKQDFSKSAFERSRTLLEKNFRFKDHRSALIQRAAAFYFVRYASHYGNGSSYRTSITRSKYQRKLDSIGMISKRLQHVDMKKRNALYYCDILAAVSRHLIYFDPPYIGSEYYYRINNQKGKVFSSHTALRNRIEQLRKKNVCVLSYRTTASATMKQHGITDEYVRHTLNRLFLGKGYYYVTQPYQKDQIEIVIATVPFAGSTPFNQPLV